tara:strand:- start:60389 stop:61576 length:1188 start_codon:yes stop_codon:yes gene_type:complete
LVLVSGSAQSDPVGKAATEIFSTTDAVILDLRPGDDAIRAPSRDAFREALGEHGELRLPATLELRRVLARSPHSALLEQGKVALASVALAYGALDCPGTFNRSEQAILDLAAASASGIDASLELRQAYLYRFLCAHRAGDVDKAMAAASMLRTLAAGVSADGRPKEISEATWQTYPVIDAQSNQVQVAVSFESEPSGAAIWVDFEERGTTPEKLILAAGEHIIALGSTQGAVSQRVSVTGAGTIRLPLHASPRKWKEIAESVDTLRAAKPAARNIEMRNLMAALEAQVAFVMQDPGRVSVWVLPLGKSAPHHIGHAPNASIAGSIALQALRDSAQAPGLDPTMPLLREHDDTKVSTSSRRWWVYGVVLGAAAVGAGFIIAQDLTDDRQRIEVAFP